MIEAIGAFVGGGAGVLGKGCELVGGRVTAAELM